MLKQNPKEMFVWCLGNAFGKPCKILSGLYF